MTGPDEAAGPGAGDGEPFGARFVAEVRRRLGVGPVWAYKEVSAFEVAGRKEVFRILSGDPRISSGVLRAVRTGTPEAAAALFVEERIPKDPVAEFETLLRQATAPPRAVPSLVALNVLVFGALVVATRSPSIPTVEIALAWGANHAPLTFGGQWWRTVSSEFLHAGPVHLLANMAALTYVGGLLERLLGLRVFLAVYLLGALGASVTSALVKPDGVSVGASGAIFALYGTLLAYVARQHGWPSFLSAWPGLRPARGFPEVPMELMRRLGHSAAAFTAWSAFFGWISPQIDQAAHMGGLATGFLSGLVVWKSAGLAARAPGAA